MKDKRLRNRSRLKETKESWQLNVSLDLGPGKGHLWDNVTFLSLTTVVMKNVNVL